MIPFAKPIITTALLLCCTGAAANIVQNPGFENGSTGWIMKSISSSKSPTWAHSGKGSAYLNVCSQFSCIDVLNGGAYIEQLLPTQVGERYNLTFWVRSVSSETWVSVFWDGVQVMRAHSPNGGMVQHTVTDLIATANGSRFQMHSMNFKHQHMSFDDISVTQMPPPPTDGPAQDVAEPGGYSLMLAALGGLVFVRRRVADKPCRNRGFRSVEAQTRSFPQG